MARRKDPVEKWLELALSEDKTRPTLHKPFLSADDEKLVCASDGHRLHATNTKTYVKPLAENPKNVTAPFFHPKGGFEHVRTFNRLQLLNDIDNQVNQTLNEKIIAQLTELNKAQELFREDKNVYTREVLENELKATAVILRAYRNPVSPVSLKEIMNAEVHLNERYLLEALSYDGPESHRIKIQANGPLDPVIVGYLDFPLAACIMPMRP